MTGGGYSSSGFLSDTEIYSPALLSANGVGYARPADGRIIVSARDATGVCVEFVKG